MNTTFEWIVASFFFGCCMYPVVKHFIKKYRRNKD